MKLRFLTAVRVAKTTGTCERDRETSPEILPRKNTSRNRKIIKKQAKNRKSLVKKIQGNRKLIVLINSIKVTMSEISSNASSTESSGGLNSSLGSISGRPSTLGGRLNSTADSNSSDSSELTHILNRRQVIMDSQEAGIEVPRTFKVVNIYTEFHEFSRKQIKEYQKTFNK